MNPVATARNFKKHSVTQGCEVRVGQLGQPEFKYLFRCQEANHGKLLPSDSTPGALHFVAIHGQRAFAYPVAQQRRKYGRHKFSRALVGRARRITVGEVSASAMTKARVVKGLRAAGWSMLRDVRRYNCDHAEWPLPDLTKPTRSGPARPAAVSAASQDWPVSASGDGRAARVAQNTTVIRMLPATAYSCM